MTEILPADRGSLETAPPDSGPSHAMGVRRPSLLARAIAAKPILGRGATTAGVGLVVGGLLPREEPTARRSIDSLSLPVWSLHGQETRPLPG